MVNKLASVVVSWRLWLEAATSHHLFCTLYKVCDLH
jgi:hypothetical protein